MLAFLLLVSLFMQVQNISTLKTQLGIVRVIIENKLSIFKI